MNGLRETQVGTIVGVEAEARPAMQCPYGATEIQQEAGGESVLLVDVILESSGKRQPRNAPQGGGKAITTTATNTIAVKLLQFLGQLKSTFLATITFRHQFEVRERGRARGGGTFN